MKYLDGKTPCKVIADNGILASVTNGEETVTVFSFRLKDTQSC
ncbi:MAG: hypothetical protein P8J32_04660 [bacterium]|nr:hypothetical protein [bacterium]